MYRKTVWMDNSTPVNAANLNNIENGVESITNDFTEYKVQMNLIVTNTKTSESNAKTSEINAKLSETNAKESETNAKSSETVTQQAMTDYLAMIGKDIATLDANGYLTASQLPPLAINDTFTVATVDEIVALVAQRGDVALVVVDDVVKNSYLLASDDPTQLANWKPLGISYVAEAGHSVNADTATNSTMINNHRLVAMTPTQFETAVLDADTYYFVSEV